MVSVGIITIIDNNNYGNRLQNYALAHFIKQNKVRVITLLNKPYYNLRGKYFFRKIKYSILEKISFYQNNNENAIRTENFKKFNQFIKFNNKVINPFFEKEKYDYYIVGSDQVWNPLMGRLRDVDLLNFTNTPNKIAYAASTAISDKNIFDKKWIKNSWLKFKEISVREDRARAPWRLRSIC